MHLDILEDNVIIQFIVSLETKDLKPFMEGK